MILLVDAHALLWWLGDDPALNQPARSAIADPANEVLVSAATIWELAIKRAVGKLELADELPDVVQQAGFGGVPVTMDDAWAAAALPPHHRDPFDRMLVAQASRLDAVIVTRDAAISAYEVAVLPA